jgi:hypothetical protein
MENALPFPDTARTVRGGAKCAAMGSGVNLLMKAWLASQCFRNIRVCLEVPLLIDEDGVGYAMLLN